jgi:membrane protease YdiL (CAAX protease family)
MLVACLAAWLHALRCWSSGRPLLEPAPRRPVPWGLVHLVATVLLVLLSQSSLAAVVQAVGGLKFGPDLSAMTPAARVWLLFAASLGSLFAAAVSVVWIVAQTGARGGDLGLDRRRAVADVRLGAVAFVMIGPPVYGLQLLLVKSLAFPTKHPLVTALRDHPDAALVAAVVFAAVVVAPVVEEYFFRVLLQGWLERLVRPQCSGLAVLASAAAFAAVHRGHGPDPIPLFFLAVGLGYLYRQTHRLLPSVVVHLLLNACSLVALFAGDAPG